MGGSSSVTAYLSRLDVELLLEVHDLISHPVRHRARQLKPMAQVPRHSRLLPVGDEEGDVVVVSASLPRPLLRTTVPTVPTIPGGAALLTCSANVTSVSVQGLIALCFPRGPSGIELLLP